MCAGVVVSSEESCKLHLECGEEERRTLLKLSSKFNFQEGAFPLSESESPLFAEHVGSLPKNSADCVAAAVSNFLALCV